MNKKFFFFIMVFAIGLLGFTACSDDDDDPANLSFEKNSVEVAKGATSTVKIITGNGGYEVGTDNKDIATAVVEDGEITITGTGVGQTKINVTDKEGRKASISVTVTDDFAELIESVYNGELKIEIAGQETPIPGQDITIERTATNQVKVLLEDFSFDNLSLGDIDVDGIILTKEGDVIKLANTSVERALGEGGVITATIATESSSVSGNAASLNIKVSNIKIGGEDIGLGVLSITFTGTKVSN